MKTYFFAKLKLVPRVIFVAFAFCFLLSEINFSQQSKVSEIAVSVNAYTNFLGDFGAEERGIFALVNDERRRKRLKTLNWDNDLARVARKYSQQMAKGNFFSHFDKNGNGVEERADAAKISWSKIGENLFFCIGIEDFNAAAVRGWLNSPEHRRNLLGKDWTDTGIGIAESRDGKIYITQVFIER